MSKSPESVFLSEVLWYRISSECPELGVLPEGLGSRLLPSFVDFFLK